LARTVNVSAILLNARSGFKFPHKKRFIKIQIIGYMIMPDVKNAMKKKDISANHRWRKHNQQSKAI